MTSEYPGMLCGDVAIVASTAVPGTLAPREARGCGNTAWHNQVSPFEAGTGIPRFRHTDRAGAGARSAVPRSFRVPDAGRLVAAAYNSHFR